MTTGGNTRGRWMTVSSSSRPRHGRRASSRATASAIGRPISTLSAATRRLSTAAEVSVGESGHIAQSLPQDRRPR